MWFLLIQILFLLLLAAALGALLTYWFVRSRYEDVTESHAQLAAQAKSFSSADHQAQDKILGEVRGLSKLIETRKTPDMLPVERRLDRIERDLKTDLSPVETRLDRLERHILGFQMPDPDLSPVQERLEFIEAQLMGPNSEIDALNGRLSRIEDMIANVNGSVRAIPSPDLDGLNARLARIEETIQLIEFPEVDLGPIHSSLAIVQAELDALEFPEPNVDPVMNKLDAMEERVERLQASFATARTTDTDRIATGLNFISSRLSSLQPPNLEPVDQRLSQIETRISSLRLPDTDLSGVNERLAQIESLIHALNLPETNLVPLEDRLERIQLRLDSPNPDLHAINRRLDELEGALGTVSTNVQGLRNTDLGPLATRLDQLNLLMREPNTDLDAVISRLNDLEAAVASVAQTANETRLQDIRPLRDQLAALGSQIGSIDSPDLTPLQSRLHDIDERISAIRVPEPDFSVLGGQLSRLDQTLSEMRADLRSQPGFDQVERQLARLQEAFLSMRQPDLEPVLQGVRTIERRLDLAAVENRLTSIEYSLAALHHMVGDRDARGQNGSAKGQSRIEFRQPPEPLFGESRMEARYASVETRSTSDPIDTVRRPGDQSNLLVEPAFGAPDDLERINGIGPMLCELLNEIGVYYFWQIAEWGRNDVDWVDGKLLHFKGRIDRDNWVAQARQLASESSASARPRASL